MIFRFFFVIVKYEHTAFFSLCICFHIRKKYFYILLVRWALALHLLLLCIFVAVFLILLDMLLFRWQVRYLGILKCALLKLFACCCSVVCNLTLSNMWPSQCWIYNAVNISGSAPAGLLAPDISPSPLTVQVPAVPPKHHRSYKLVLFPAIGALIIGLAVLLVTVLILLICRKNKELKKIEGNNPIDAWSFSCVKKGQEGKNFLIFLLCSCNSFMNVYSFGCAIVLNNKVIEYNTIAGY